MINYITGASLLSWLKQFWQEISAKWGDIISLDIYIKKWKATHWCGNTQKPNGILEWTMIHIYLYKINFQYLSNMNIHVHESEKLKSK